MNSRAAPFHQLINSKEELGSTVNTSIVVKQHQIPVQIVSSLHIQEPAEKLFSIVSSGPSH